MPREVTPFRILASLLAFGLSIGLLHGTTTSPSGEPLESGVVEEESVKLVLLDVLVHNRKGEVISDLTIDDFEVTAAGDLIELDTLDVRCETVETGEEPPPRIVLAFDYQHLGHMQRAYVFDEARRYFNKKEPGAEVMIVALTGGLRIEQMFSTDRTEVAKSLRRMEHDISLWGGNFTHTTESGFVSGLTALFDVLGTIDGPKSVVLYSGMTDAPLESQFQALAGKAAASRCAIYPVDAGGIRADPNAMANIGPGSGGFGGAPPPG